MASIKDVARISGVSIATVSRYLNSPELVKETTREKILSAINEIDYSPNALAQSFRKGRSGLVYVVIPNVGDPFLSDVTQAIEHVAKKQGIRIVIRETLSSTPSAAEYNQLIFSKQADGLILLASNLAEPEKLDNTESNQLPIILGCESISPEASRFPSVRIDNYQGAKDAVSHFIKLGHRDIAFISGSHTSTLTQDRELGFVDAIADHNLKLVKDWMLEADMSIDSARKCTRALLEQHRIPSAILCANDEMALGCIHEIKAAGLKVPEDISIIGFDNIRYSEISDPPLTTIAQPAELIGKRVMERLLDAISGLPMRNDVEIVPHELVIRRSTTMKS